MNLVGKLDASLALTRPLWLWLGQVALVVLGTHLAADRMDDDLGRLLAGLPLAWPDPQTPIVAGAWMALGMELAVALWALLALARTAETDVRDGREWARRLSVHNVVGPLFWLPVSLAGSWVIAMAVEDALPAGPIAIWTGRAIGLVVAWRLAWSGLSRLLFGARVPKHRADGLIWVVPLLVVAGYAAWYGLPIWSLGTAWGAS